MERQGVLEGGLLGNAHNLTIMIDRYIRRNVQGTNISQNTMNDLKEYLIDIQEYKTDIKSQTTPFGPRQDGLSKQSVLDELDDAKMRILALVTEPDMPGGARIKKSRSKKRKGNRRTRRTRRRSSNKRRHRK